MDRAIGGLYLSRKETNVFSEKALQVTYALRRFLEKVLDEFPHYHSGQYPENKPLMISVHVPKTAGTSFRTSLRQLFGRSLHYDYGSTNATTSGTLKKLFEDCAVKDCIAADFYEKYAKTIRCIHGHFPVGKYVGIFPGANYVAWLREPVDRVYSQFHSHKRAYDPFNEAGAKAYKGELSILEYARLEENRNLQSKLLGGLPLECYGFLGLTEMYDMCFSRFLGANDFPGGIVTLKKKNISRKRSELDPEARAQIAALNSDDVALYEYACSRFF